jgi:hypothetical protein
VKERLEAGVRVRDEGGIPGVIKDWWLAVIHGPLKRPSAGGLDAAGFARPTLAQRSHSAILQDFQANSVLGMCRTVPTKPIASIDYVL